MTIKLNLQEKCYLVALFGDVSERQRERLFGVSAFPAQAGPVVMAEGFRFIGTLNDGREVFRKPSLFDGGTSGG